MITLQKISKWQYNVFFGEKKIGELIKETAKGSGRGYSQYVGYVKSYTRYVFWPENDNDTDGAAPAFDSVKEAKEKIGVIYEANQTI